MLISHNKQKIGAASHDSSLVVVSEVIGSGLVVRFQSYHIDHAEFATVVSRQCRGEQPDTKAGSQHNPDKHPQLKLLNNQNGRVKGKNERDYEFCHTQPERHKGRQQRIRPGDGRSSVGCNGDRWRT